jgi:hypothetical protein
MKSFCDYDEATLSTGHATGAGLEGGQSSPAPTRHGAFRPMARPRGSVTLPLKDRIPSRATFLLMKLPRLFSALLAALIAGMGASAETSKSGGSTSGGKTGTGGDNTAVSPDLPPVRTPTTPPPSPNTPPPGSGGPVTPGTPAQGASAIRTTGDQGWRQIQGHTFEQREEFITNLARLEVQLEQSITGLKTKRTTFTGDPNAWDSEMKRLDDAKAYLRSTSAELAKATAANWEERKERVATAWERLQDAYERASGMTTTP